MQPRTACLLAAAAICFTVLALAFWFAPDSCKGGWEAYVSVGIVALSLLFVAPFVVRSAPSLAGRAAWAAGSLVAGSAVWLAGLFIANFRVICSLF